jgi:hypothetical protein
LGEVARRVGEELPKDGLLVVADHAHFLDVRDLGDGRQAVPDYWVASDGEEWLNISISLVHLAWYNFIASTFGTSRERGRNLVPLDGPPT